MEERRMDEERGMVRGTLGGLINDQPATLAD